METYTLPRIQQMLGLSRAVIGALIAAGFVTPSRGKRNEYRFSFQDVVLLRTAHSLQAAQIPPRRILTSLQKLKATLPEQLPLSGLRISAVGKDIAVTEGAHRWSAESGQLLIDFEVKPAAGKVSLLNRAPPPPAKPAPPAEDAQDWFDRAVELEGASRARAEQAYRKAIKLAPDFVDPYLNLGVLLADAGKPADAVAIYRLALKHCADAPLLHFNLAIALEDLGRFDEALAAYDACLQLAPAMADAHYNAARLHEQRRNPRMAIRHYSEYRRLQRQ